jgi:hypothetical protein
MVLHRFVEIHYLHDMQISQDQREEIESVSIALPTELTFFSLRYN